MGRRGEWSRENGGFVALQRLNEKHRKSGRAYDDKAALSTRILRHFMGLNQPNSLQEATQSPLERIRLGYCSAGKARRVALAAGRPTARKARLLPRFL